MLMSQTSVKTFGQLDPRKDLGAHFTALGVRYRFVVTDRTRAAALVVGGPEKDHVVILDRETQIDQVNHS